LALPPAAPRVWQLGGEIAEQLASDAPNATDGRATLRAELERWLPDLDLANLELAVHAAPRAEARHRDALRPSGVHMSRAAPNVLACWPTKLALAPLLAEDVARELGASSTTTLPPPPSACWPTAPLANYPWETTAWITLG
jgi:hypothetical protein